MNCQNIVLKLAAMTAANRAKSLNRVRSNRSDSVKKSSGPGIIKVKLIYSELQV